jgi:hypothetical protein
MSGKNYGPNVSGYLDPTARNWRDVIFQAGKAVLDKELNLGQDIDVGTAEQDLRRDLPSGWLSNDFLATSGATSLFVSSAGGNALTLLNALVAHVNGWTFKVQDTGTINTNTVNLGAAPTGTAAQRTDFVFLEVWLMLLSPAPSTVGKSQSGLIFQWGNVKTDPANDATLNFPDDIKDAVLGQESTKRVQIQYRLRVVEGVDTFSYPYGLDSPSLFANTVPPNASTPDGTPTTFNYVNQSANGDAGLWIAGDGNPANALGTVDGYMYAIPLCSVFRRNSTAFSPFSNLNGAGATFGHTSDRPDGLFNDAFVADDVADMRMGVSPSGWNYQEVLDKNLTFLLDNSLRSEWMATAPYGGGTTGHSPFFSNQVGISSANGGSAPYSGDATGGGPRTAQFDNVCRTFSGRPVFEVMTVAVPPPGGGWTNGSTVTINPSSLAVYPYAAFNWSSFAPSAVEFVDVLRADWIGDGTSGKTHRYKGLAPTVAVVNVTNNGGLIEIQTAYATSITTGSGVVISGVTGTTEANGAWTVTAIDSTHFTLNNSVFTNPYVSGGTVSFSNINSISGLGTQPISNLTITCGQIAPLGLSQETLYVDVLVAYPPQNGLSTTPTADFQTTAQTFMVNNPSTLPDAAPVYFDQTLLTAWTSPFAFFNATPSLAYLDWAHREARMTYTTSQVNNLTITVEADSMTAGATTVTLPERVSHLVSISNSNSGPTTGTVDVTGRVIQSLSPATNPGDKLTITYRAIRPFPQHGEQVTIYFDTRAPQTARSQILSNTVLVIPKYIPKQLYALSSGVASPDDGYPFPYAYVQTGGVYAPAFLPGGIGEYELGGEALISISDFNASTGLLALPVYVNFTPDPDQVSFIRAPTDVDSEGRSYFKQTQASVYIPNAYAQDLSDPRRHKNFMAFLAELAADSPLGFAGQLVLVLMTRWADNDETDGVFFDTNLSNNTTAASIFRLRTNLLNKRV